MNVPTLACRLFTTDRLLQDIADFLLHTVAAMRGPAFEPCFEAFIDVADNELGHAHSLETIS